MLVGPTVYDVIDATCGQLAGAQSAKRRTTLAASSSWSASPHDPTSAGCG
jgi:hypothetical protein